MTRHALHRRRRSPLVLRAQVWRPRRAAAPLSPAELSVLAAVLRAPSPEIRVGEIVGAAIAAGLRFSARELGIASTRLHRLGLCRRRGKSSDRISLTAAGRLVARIEASHLPVAPLRARPAQEPAVEVWHCARRAGEFRASGGAS